MRSPQAKPLRSKEDRDELVLQYLPLVKYVVARLPVTMPATLDRDDFCSVGVMGLMHAATTYDPSRGASFKTFAFTAIRGAILDEIRKHDPIPRSRRDRLRKLDRAAAELYAKLGQAPTLENIAEHLGITADDLDQDLLALHTCRVLSLNDGASGQDGFSLGSGLVCGAAVDPEDQAIDNELKEELARGISELPEVDRHVIVLYHYESLYLKEIGEILGVSESRISQILSRAMARLRLKMHVREEA
ncbi:MAG: FliA/WhiG family RNA polymerase sigma factor [Planctomycetota bacterium]|jgi:RNA polymerase sigma factor for flagellar operon FliA